MSSRNARDPSLGQANGVRVNYWLLLASREKKAEKTSLLCSFSVGLGFGNASLQRAACSDLAFPFCFAEFNSLIITTFC